MKLFRYHGEKTDALFSAWVDTWLEPNLQDWNMFRLLEAIRCPLLLMQGELDEYGTSAQLEHIAARVKGKTEVCLLPGIGHIPHLQARAEVIDIMTAFILPLLTANALVAHS
jgi:pimeloyl-ACP methyl ester carboxylesterase